MHLVRLSSVTFALIALASAALAPAAARAQSLERIDVNVTPVPQASLQSQLFTAIGSLTFFEGDDAANGRELWRTDGTAAGTFLLCDIAAGPADSSIRDLTVAGQTLYFIAEAVPYDRRLWRSDGTVAGTRPVRDAAGDIVAAQEITAVGGTIFFTVYDGDHIVLMKTDGTPGGTIQVISFAPDFRPTGLVATNGRAFFALSTPSSQHQLWRSDGTAAGTGPLADLCAAPCGLEVQLTASGSQVFFVANGLGAGSELWVTDGTPAGTGMVRDLTGGPDSTTFEEFVDASGVLYFVTRAPVWQLWRTDGTAEGTTLALSDYVRGPAPLGTSVLFLRNGHLWRSAGTPASTVEIADVCGTSCSIPDRLVPAGGLVYAFVNQTLFSDTRLWRSDGTTAGTAVVGTFPGGASATYVSPSPNDPAGQQAGAALYFTARDAASGSELWRSAGSAASTVQLTQNVTSPSNPTNLVATGDGRLFFNAGIGFDYERVWTTLGTPATTAPVPGPRGFAFDAWTPLRGGLLFSMDQNADGGIWWSDGTPAGTRVLRPGAHSGAMTTVGDVGFASSGGLLTTDGTEAGTRLVFGLGSPAPGGASRLAATDTLAFAWSSDVWRTDGTAVGSFEVMQNAASALRGFAGRMYFYAHVPIAGFSLVANDGTIAGTRVLAPGNESGGTSARRTLHPHRDALYFVGEGAAGAELWRTDGSVAGTRLVKDVRPGPDGSRPAWLTSVGPWLYFVADDGVHGYELWRTDGTEASTLLVRDIAPGAESPFSEVLADGVAASFGSTGNELLFAAWERATGLELWASDGTATGTRLLRDIAPGPSSSSPQHFARAGSRDYFRADDGTGAELWTVAGPPTVSIGGASVVEGDAGTSLARFPVTLSSAAAAPVAVAYSTAPGTAQAGSDYLPSAGSVTFPAGAVGPLAIEVPIVGDLADEELEWFAVELTGGGAIEDGVGVGAIHDDDAPRFTVSSATVPEAAGPVELSITLRTADGGPAASSKTVSFQTPAQNAAPGTDYSPVSGVVTFAAGSPDGSSHTVPVNIWDDRLPEPPERFELRAWPLEEPPAATAVGTVTIADDDGPATARGELAHGTVYRGDLASLGGAPARDLFGMTQQPFASYEIVADEVSADAAPLLLRRLGSTGDVLGEAGPVGTGTARSLVWANDWEQEIRTEHVSVEGGGCGPSCGADDRYRLRAMETTLRAARVTAELQQTSLVLHNQTDRTVKGKLWLWRSAPLTAPNPVSFTIAPRGTWVFAVNSGFSGSATITHDAGYGGLTGKAVTFDTAGGFTFDTPFTSRPR